MNRELAQRLRAWQRPGEDSLEPALARLLDDHDRLAAVLAELCTHLAETEVTAGPGQLGIVHMDEDEAAGQLLHRMTFPTGSARITESDGEISVVWSSP